MAKDDKHAMRKDTNTDHEKQKKNKDEVKTRGNDKKDRKNKKTTEKVNKPASNLCTIDVMEESGKSESLDNSEEAHEIRDISEEFKSFILGEDLHSSRKETKAETKEMEIDINVEESEEKTTEETKNNKRNRSMENTNDEISDTEIDAERAGDEVTSIDSNIKRIDDMINRILTICDRHPEAKKEIKLTVECLRAACEWMCHDYHKKIYAGRKIEQERRKVRVINATHGTQDEEIRTYAETATQTETAEEIRAEILNQKIEKATEVEEVIELIKEEWPESCYKISEIKTTTDYEIPKGWDMLVLLDPSKTNESETQKNLIKRHPDAMELLDDWEEGKIEYVERTVKNSKEKMKTNIIYVAPIKTEETRKKNQIKIWETINNFIEGLDKQEIKNQQIGIVTSEELKTEDVNKIVEMRGRKSEYRFAILQKTEKLSRVEYRRQQSQLNERTNEVLIIKAGDKEYANVVKEIKDKVNIQETTVNITSINKTLKGDVCIRVQKDKRGGANELQRILKDKVEGIKVTVKSREELFHILDVEPDEADEKVVEILERKIDVGQGIVKIIRSRPMRNGNKIVTVTVEKKGAEVLKEVNSVKVGWTNCRVRQNVTVERCYRCMQFGHATRNCEGTERANRCYNCDKEGHIAQECKEQSYCTTCKTEGHRADSMKCESYRKRIIEERRKMTREKRKGQGYEHKGYERLQENDGK